MIYKIYKLKFYSGIHIGNRNLSEGLGYIHSDTFFSALCNEAITTGGEELLLKIVDEAKNNKLVISDAMPFVENTPLLPKPMCHIDSNKESDSVQKKKFKKLSFISADKIDKYLSGTINVDEQLNLAEKIGKFNLVQKSKINVGDDSELYSVGRYAFYENSGLYIIVGAENEEILETVEDLIDSLSFSGIGGERSSGYGRFEYSYMKNQQLIDRISKDSKEYVLLSTAMAGEDELLSTLTDASYKLIKRSGFVFSNTYNDVPLKKRDMFMFSAGSVFKNKFLGDVFDVSDNGAHSVYKCGKAMLLGV